MRRKTGGDAQAVTAVDDPVGRVPTAAASDRREKDALDAFPEPFVTLRAVRDEAGRVTDLICTSMNSAAATLWDDPAELLLGRRLGELIPSVHERGTLGRFTAPLVTGQPSTIRVSDFDERGTVVAYELTSYPFGDEVIVVARDASAELATAAALEESERRFRLLAENAMDLVFSMDTRGNLEWVSPSVTPLLGYDPAELAGRPGAILLHPDDLPLLLETAASARAGTPASCRVRMRRITGDDRWVEVTPRGIADESGTLIGGVVAVRDIHDEVLAQRELDRAIDFDTLTALARRPLAVTRIQNLLDIRPASGSALLCVGVQGVTAVNQAYTYAAGDAMLVEVARRLVAVAGSAERVARIAGDEFTVHVPDIASRAAAADAAAEVLRAVGGAMSFEGHPLEIAACLGIAMAHGHDAEALVRDATAAMRQASRSGPDRWGFPEGDVGDARRRELTVQSALREAVQEHRIVAWFMPIVSLADGRVLGHEALARWVREDGSVAAPAEFLEIAERTGLILDIDRAVLLDALHGLAGSAQTAHVAVNVSAATLTSGTLVDVVEDALGRTGVEPHRLHLEVTETALFHVTDAVRHTMAILADRGVSWWVDDFGTGYSSLSHLRDLPIAGIKLDRSFTAEVTQPGSTSAALADGLAGLARALRLGTVAEGVETALQARVLNDLGWRWGQGWHYGKAVPLPGSTEVVRLS